MQYKLLFVFAALLVCSQALTIGESTGALYSINQKRHDDLLIRMERLYVFADYDRDALLKTSVTIFAFTCNQVAELINTYTFADSRLNALDILKANIIDPQNNAIILNSFSRIDRRTDAAAIRANLTALLANVVACKIDGAAPEKFPDVVLPYKDQWNQTDIEALVEQIDKAYVIARDKLPIVENTLASTSKILTFEQVSLLYDSFTYSELALTELVKDRIVGLTCDQVISILNRILFRDERLDALRALKHNIIDVENKLTIVDSFKFPISAKDEARKILDDLQLKSSL